MRPIHSQNLRSMKFWRCWRFYVTKPLTATMTRRSTIGSFIRQLGRRRIRPKTTSRILLCACKETRTTRRSWTSVCKVQKSNRKKSQEREDRCASVARFNALSTFDAIFVIGGIILRLTVLIGSPVVPNRLPNQTNRMWSDRTGVINVGRHCVL